MSRDELLSLRSIVHRRPKLRIRGVIFLYIFLLLCERSAKRDMGHILYYLTIELDHAKRDSRLVAYGGVLLHATA